MEHPPAVNTDRTCFIEMLNQEYLAAKGYGASAFLAPNTVLTLFNQYLNQNQPEQDFIKSVVKHPLRLG